jgi:FkbM family methyltransferase
MVKRIVKSALLGAGLELRRHNPAYVPDVQLANVLRRQRIDTVFDVGANIGQYGGTLRKLGFAGTIVSFEPLSSAHAALTAAAAADARWQVASRGAIGATDGEIMINVAGNSVSSSVLDMLGSHADAAPDSRYTGQEAVPIHRLDSIVGDWLGAGSRLFLKVDTQGFEGAVLEGAAATLARTRAVQLELSLTPLYDGQLMAEDIIARLRAAGFAPWTLWPGFADSATGRLLQIDAIFVREDGA